MTTSHATVCPHDCPSVCAIEVEMGADGRMGRVRGSDRNPYTAGVVCAKVARYAERYHHPDRLSHPLRRTGEKGSGAFERIAWDDALDLIAGGFTKATQAHGSESVWPYFYAGTMGYVQRDGINRLTHVMRYSRFKGTICVALSNAGWNAGAGKRYGVPAMEIPKSDLVVVWGTNPVATHVNMMTHISQARKRGVPFVVVDPYRSPTAEQADIHLALRPGTDGALACGVMQVLFREGFADRAYLEKYTDAPAELEAHLATRTPEWAAAITGLTVDEITDFARLYGRTKRSYLRLGYGFTRSRNGAAAMHAASCLPAVTGAWQHEGGGALYSMGSAYHLDSTMIEGLDRLDPTTRELDQSRIGPILMGDKEALLGGPPVTAMLIQNTNPAVIAPEQAKVLRGLVRPDLFVAVQEQFPTPTAKFADVVLPATMFVEHDDIYTASAHDRLQIGRAIFPPHEEARENRWVIAELAKRLGAEHPGFGMTAWEMVDDLCRRSGWPDAETIHASGGWAVQPDYRKAHYLDGFGFPDGKFRFKPDWKGMGPDGHRMPVLPDHLDNIDAPTAEKPFRLVAAPARQFLNSSFTEMPTSRRREGRPTALLHPETMTKLGLAEGARIRLGNERGAVLVHAKAKDGMQRDTIVVEGIWPNEHFEDGHGINTLLSAEPAPPDGGAVIHDTAVWLEVA